MYLKKKYVIFNLSNKNIKATELRNTLRCLNYKFLTVNIFMHVVLNIKKILW